MEWFILVILGGIALFVYYRIEEKVRKIENSHNVICYCGHIQQPTYENSKAQPHWRPDSGIHTVDVHIGNCGQCRYCKH